MLSIGDLSEGFFFNITAKYLNNSGIVNASASTPVVLKNVINLNTTILSVDVQPVVYINNTNVMAPVATPVVEAPPASSGN